MSYGRKYFLIYFYYLIQKLSCVTLSCVEPPRRYGNTLTVPPPASPGDDVPESAEEDEEELREELDRALRPQLDKLEVL